MIGLIIIIIDMIDVIDINPHLRLIPYEFNKCWRPKTSTTIITSNI